MRILWFTALWFLFFPIQTWAATPCKSGFELYKQLYKFERQAEIFTNARQKFNDKERAAAILIWKQDGYSNLFMPKGVISTLGTCYRDGKCEMERSLAISLSMAIDSSTLLTSPKIERSDSIPEKPPLISVLWAEKKLRCGTENYPTDSIQLKADAALMGRAKPRYEKAKLLDQIGDYAAAFTAFDIACKDGLAPACHEKARAHYNGLGAPKDIKASFSAFIRGCSVGYLESCSLGALVAADLMQDIEDQGHIVKSAKTYRGYAMWGGTLYVTACHYGSFEDCGLFSAFIEKHFQGNAQQEAQAFKYAQYGCDNDDSYSCVELASHYFRGIAVPKNTAKSKTAFEKSKRLQAPQ